MNTILGMTKSFKSDYYCRFCSIHREKARLTFVEDKKLLRTPESYEKDLLTGIAKETGIVQRSIFYNFKSVEITKVLTVDNLYDVFEGIIFYDLGYILKHYIENCKYFTLRDLAKRMKNFSFGKDEIRNKPRPIPELQIKAGQLKMSGSESHCLIKNIGLLIGDFIPEDDEFWQIIVYLKEIVDIVTAPAITEATAKYLAFLIELYLRLLVKLIPNAIKPKHHFLLHYPFVLLRFGPTKFLSTIRCESKHRVYKMTSSVCRSRVNICKTLAVKSQLMFARRLMLNKNIDTSIYAIRKESKQVVEEIRSLKMIRESPVPASSKDVSVVDDLEFKGKTVEKNSVLVIPNDSIKERNVLLVHDIIKIDDTNVQLIVQDVTDYTYYVEHYQAYRLHENYKFDTGNYQCREITELHCAYVSRLVVLDDGLTFIPKRWT